MLELRHAFLIAVVLSAACGGRTPTRPNGFVPSTGGGNSGPTPKDAGIVDTGPPCEDICTGGTCRDDGTCVMTPVAGAEEVRCPDGVACEIDCRADNSCRTKMFCGTGPCSVVCEGLLSCNGPVTCGSGPCKITCGGGAGRATCAGPFKCSGSSDCEVLCLSQGACRAPIECGSGPCKVRCGTVDNAQSCRHEVRCADSCACDLQCIGPDTCGRGYMCPDGCATANGCSADLPGCNVCSS